VVDGFKEGGTAIGEGAAVLGNKELTDKLNAIYGTDVSSAQRTMLAIRMTAALTGAAGVAKAGGELTEATTKAIGKKLNDVAAAKEAAMAQAKAKAENNTTRDMAGLGNSASRDFQPGQTYRAENINAGQVTDRDGVQRIDDAKTNSDLSQGFDERTWITQRPAWKEGTLVTDRV